MGLGFELRFGSFACHAHGGIRVYHKFGSITDVLGVVRNVLKASAKLRKTLNPKLSMFFQHLQSSEPLSRRGVRRKAAPEKLSQP